MKLSIGAGRNELESLKLAPWASRRRQDLLDVLGQLTPKIQERTRALEEEVEKRPVTRRLMTHPGVGPAIAAGFFRGNQTHVAGNLFPAVKASRSSNY